MIGPEHAWLHDQRPRRIRGRLRRRSAGRRRACCSHAKASFRRSNPRTPWPKRCSARPQAKGQIFLVNISGRGDKDIDIYRENFQELDEA